MEKEQYEKLMNLKPSDFYCWLWKQFYSHKISKKQKDLLSEKFDERHADDPIELDEPEMFPASKEMPNFVIQTPIWAEKAIGLNEAKLREENLIEIAYRDKDGVKLYPHLYSISKLKALVYPVKKIKGNDIRIIPIADLNIKEEH